MSYAELGSAIFRGELQGATGEAKFKLTADAINAVDAINIKNGAVTYNIWAITGPRLVNKNELMLSLNVNIIEAYAYIEVHCYCMVSTFLWLDGSPLKLNNKRGHNGGIMSPAQILKLNNGMHTLSLYSDADYIPFDTVAWTYPLRCRGTSYIVARYIRETGLSWT